MAEVGYIFPNDAAKQVLAVGDAIKIADDALIKYAADAGKLVELLKSQNISFEQLATAQKKAEKTTKDLDNVGKKLIQSEQRLKELEDVRTQSIIKNRTEANKQTQEIKKSLIAANAQKGAYDKIAASLGVNIAKWKSLSAAERENGKIGKQLLGTIQQQDAQLKKLDTQIGRSQRNVGNYRSALAGTAKSMIAAFGVGSGVYLFVNVLKNSFNTIRSFTKENAVLAGVLGTTRDEITKLTDQAIAFRFSLSGYCLRGI